MSDPDTFAQTSKRFRMHEKSNDSLLVFNRGEDPNIFNNYVSHDGVSVRIDSLRRNGNIHPKIYHGCKQKIPKPLARDITLIEAKPFIFLLERCRTRFLLHRSARRINQYISS
jgi:hypothetical protein